MALKRSYRVLRALVRLFTPRMKTVWETPFDGEACVFCPNHARAWGPVDMCVHFSLRDAVHPWYNAGVIDRKGLPAYIRNDNWWNPKSRLAGLYSAVIPPVVARVLPPIIRCTPGIPVYYDIQVYRTFRESVEVLSRGEHLVIFPQFPNGYQSHAEQLSRGFVLIAPMAWKRLGLRLKFYPVHVDRRARTIRVLPPVQYDPEAPREEEEERLLAYLGKGIWDDPA